jgi:hypothetical protein
MKETLRRRITVTSSFTKVSTEMGNRVAARRAVLRIRIRDPVTFLPLDPGSGIGFFRIPDLGSQTQIFESLVTIFWVKSSITLRKLAQIFFYNTSRIK